MSTARPFNPESEAGIISADELAGIIGAELGEAERLRAVALAVIQKYSCSAPNEIMNEAVIRFSGYLAASEASGYGAYKQVSMGVDIGLQHLHGPMFRNSGAAALLSPWKVRRAGAI